MSDNLDLFGFLMLGLLGGFAHCAGMCSPFVMLVSRRHARPAVNRSALGAQLWYAGGRIATYAALGALAGTLGKVVGIAGAWIGWQRTAAVVAGLLLIGWSIATLMDLAPRVSPCGGWFRRVADLLRGHVPGHPVTIGLFLGLLPCGLLYTALLGAVGRDGPLDGAVALVAFGLGTTPALLGVSLADRLLASGRPWLDRLSHAFMLLMGVWYLWRGLSA